MRTTTEKLDASEAFVLALNDLGPHMEAAGKLCMAAVELRRWGVTLNMAAHNLTRDEFDSYDGVENHFPPDEKRPYGFWSKTVELYNGDFDTERGCEGRVVLTLYTHEAPATEDAVVA